MKDIPLADRPQVMPTTSRNSMESTESSFISPPPTYIRSSIVSTDGNTSSEMKRMERLPDTPTSY